METAFISFTTEDLVRPVHTVSLNKHVGTHETVEKIKCHHLNKGIAPRTYNRKSRA